MRYLTPTLILLLLVSLIANGVMWAKWRSHRAIMTVNGVGVSKYDMDSYLEQTSAPQFKAMMTQRILIHGEAQRLGLTATDAEVLESYNTAKELDWQFAQRMRQNPWLADETKNNIRDTIEQHRIHVHEIPVTEDDIAEEYKRNSLKYDEPDRAKTELAVLSDITNEDQIFQLMQKSNPPVQPSTIMQNFPNEVGFLGDNNVYTFIRPQGNPTLNKQIFDMKKDEVKKMAPPPEMVAQNVKALIVRMIEVIPGKKADLKDPKVKEKIRYAVAVKRARPMDSVLGDLWDKMKFDSEDPNDKLYIESFLLPDRYRREIESKKKH